MDFFELNAFCTFSKTLHFARTAEKVNLSPSALSRLVSRLEDEARTPLVFAASTGGPYEKVSGSPQDIVSSVPLILPKTGLAS